MNLPLNGFSFSKKVEKMEDEDRKLITKMTALIGGIALSAYALHLGFDGYLALVAIVALFGGEKVLEKLLSRGE